MSRPRSLGMALLVFGGGVVSGIILHAHHWPRAEARGVDKPAGEAPGDAMVKTIFENQRVAVRSIDLPPGTRRPGRTRPTDEMVLFCEEAHYQAVDAQGRTEPRDRTPGTVVWHSKGEVAPTLVNPGRRPVHYYGISLK